MGEKTRIGGEEALRGNNGSRIGWEARTGTEANLMRCDKEWRGDGTREGDGVSPRSGARDRGQRVRSAAHSPLWQFSVSCRIPTH